MSVLSNLFSADVLRRAAKTFFQAFVAALALPATDAFNLAAWKGAVLAAVAAAFSVVWNTVLNPAVEAVKVKVAEANAPDMPEV